MDCRSLTRLRLLHLSYAEPSEDEYEPLASLPVLERLRINACFELPSCLNRLPALRVLCTADSPTLRHLGLPENERQMQEAAALQQALSTLTARQLAQISQLEVMGSCPADCSQALQRFSGLQMLQVQLASGSAPLPVGAWLHSLRLLALRADDAARALPVLAAATRLESLAVHTLVRRMFSAAEEDRPLLVAILAWAPQQRSLRLLEFDSGDILPAATQLEGDGAICAAIERAQQAAPTLCVQFGHSLTDLLCSTLSLPDIDSYA